MEDEKLVLIVTSLLASRKEGEYWDFKRDFHENKASLLHDILCMANNLTDHDGMIIFGIQDKTFEVIGVDQDTNRRDLNYYINFLKDKEFAGGVRPKIEFHSVFISGKSVDVLLVKNTDTTPYYLTKDYKDQGKVIRSNYIYTRVGESNTDINKSADIDAIEKLWAKRLNVTKRTPKFKIRLLGYTEDGAQEDAHSFAYTYPSGLIHARRYDEDDLIDGVTMEDLRRYNESLPEQEEIEDFNKQQKLYEDVESNSHKVFFQVKNSGDAPGTSIYVTLYFPPEILVYSEYDCDLVREPEKLDMPEDPVEKAISARYQNRLEHYMEHLGELSAVFEISERYNQLCNIKPLSVLPISGHDFSIDDDHGELEVFVEDLLHTRKYESDDFFLVITKRGKYNIEYEIMCEEFQEPQTGKFEICAEI